MLLVLTVLVNAWVAAAIGETWSDQPRVISLPQEEVSHIPSPDGKWTLTFECPNECSQRKLWIEDNGAHTRRLIRNFDRSLSVSWAPDGRHFFVNDAWGSNGEACFVYEPAALNAADMAEVIVAKSPDVKRFLNAGHSYVRASRWVDSHELIIVLFGHFDEPPLGGFTLRYRVDLNGNVHKLSQKQSEDEPR